MSGSAGTGRGRFGRDARRQGQSLVEFALVFPIFMLVLVAIFDFGLGLFSQMTVINSAREGARVGIVDPTDSTGICAQAQATSTGLVLANWTCTVVCRDTHSPGDPVIQCVDAKSGDIVQVSVDYDYHMIIPLAGLLQIASHSGGGSASVLPMASTVSMRIE